MAIGRKVLAALLTVGLLVGSRAATNEYYTKPEVKKIVDNVVQAYGGVEKLRQFDRVKAVLDSKRGANTGKVTLYRTPSMARMDTELTLNRRRGVVVHIFDGKAFVSTFNGKRVPTDEDDKSMLLDMIERGVFHGPRTLLNKEIQLSYRGKKERDGTSYHVLETVNESGASKEHYIDPETYRQPLEVLRQKDGTQTHVIESFGEFKGAVYPRRMIIKGADGSLRSSSVVKEVTNEFGDEVFVVK